MLTLKYLHSLLIISRLTLTISYMHKIFTCILNYIWTNTCGYPLRVVVLGAIGACSVKWLKKIEVIVDECHGFFM